jgi:hypothetical protein
LIRDIWKYPTLPIYREQEEREKDLLSAKHDNDNLCKLWHRRMGHLHYKALPIMREIVTGLPNFNIEQQDVCRGRL